MKVKVYVEGGGDGKDLRTKCRRGCGFRRKLDSDCMEAWFLADRDALAAYFGQGFNRNALPGRQEVEEVAKADLFDALKNATRQCRKGEYGKGRHSFDILEQIDPDKVRNASPHAQHLVNTLQEKAG